MKALKLKLVMVLAMCTLQAMDAVSTIRAFGRGAVELNPLIGTDVTRVLLFKSLACLVCCLLVMRTSSIRPQAQMRRCALYAGLFAVIVFSNWSL